MMFTITALILVSSANYWLIFHAPKMRMPGPTVNFILINPPKPKEPEKEEKLPWWGYGLIFCAIILGQSFPVIGFIELFLLGVLMWWVWMIEIKLADRIFEWVAFNLLWWFLKPMLNRRASKASYKK